MEAVLPQPEIIQVCGMITEDDVEQPLCELIHRWDNKYYALAVKN